MGHARTVVLALALIAAGGCAAPVGDFGRPRPGVLSDNVMPLVGETAAWLRGEPVSAAPYTDDERRLRDLAFAILMPPDERQLWERTLAEWRRTRLLPERFTQPDPADYADTLLRTAYRSSTARYAKLMDDIRADIGRVGPVFEAAARVAAMDAVRERAIGQMWHVSPKELEHASVRIAENDMIVDWVRRRFAERFAGYQLALDRLVVATPAPAAVDTERTLAILAGRIAEHEGRIAAAAPRTTVSK